MSEGRRTAGRGRHEPGAPAAGSPSEEPGADRVATAQPQRVRRHGQRGVLVEQRDQRIHVVAKECVHVAVDQLRMRLGERLSGYGNVGHVTARERAPRALQSAVDRCDRRFQAFGDLGGGPADDLGQEQHRPLLRREMLQRRHESETDGLPEHGELRRIGAGRERTDIGHRLEPMGARQRLQRVVGRAGGARLDRAASPRAVGKHVEADVGSNPVEPRAQRGAPVESLEAAPCTDHGLLHGVVRIDGRAHHPIAVAGQGRAVLLELRCCDRHGERDYASRHRGGNRSGSRSTKRAARPAAFVSSFVLPLRRR